MDQRFLGLGVARHRLQKYKLVSSFTAASEERIRPACVGHLMISHCWTFLRHFLILMGGRRTARNHRNFAIHRINDMLGGVGRAYRYAVIRTIRTAYLHLTFLKAINMWVGVRLVHCRTKCATLTESTQKMKKDAHPSGWRRSS